jgi:hypothetical protein
LVSEAESTAPLARASKGLENLYIIAGLPEKEGEDRPGEAAANNENTSGRNRHDNYLNT